MKKIFLLFAFFLVFLADKASALDVGKEYFVRTTLHVVRGDEIYWINYTDKSVPIKAGEKVRITGIDGHLIRFDWKGREYNFAFTEKGWAGDAGLYAKFFTETDVNKEIQKHSQDIQDKISRGRVENGMTKDQVLLAVGCPAVVDRAKTYNLSLKEIISSDLWIYYFNRFNRWAVTFADGKVVSIRN